MSLDQLTNKENSMLISNANPVELVSPLLASSVKAQSLPSERDVHVASYRPVVSLPALALSLPDTAVHFPPLSSSSIQGHHKSMYKHTLSPCPLPTDTTMSKHSPISPSQNQGRKACPDSTTVEGMAVQSAQNPMELITFVNGNHPQEGTAPVNPVPGHVYFTVNGASSIAYVQQESDKSLPVHQPYQHPQYIVAPMNNNCNGLVVGGNGLNQNHSGMQLISQPVVQSQSLPSTIPPTIVSYPQPTSHPSVTHPVQVSQPYTLVQNNSAHMTLPAKHLQSQSTGTLLSYSQAEITLNQLNAVPNLAPPKSLHQPVMSVPVGSPLVPNVVSESPYIIPVIHENAVQSKVNTYVYPATLRCRESSLSAAESCSTASASGAEEEETAKVDTETNDLQQPGLLAKKVCSVVPVCFTPLYNVCHFRFPSHCQTPRKLLLFRPSVPKCQVAMAALRPLKITYC